MIGYLRRIIPPATLGIVEFTALRLATDPSRSNEWWPEPQNQFRGILLTIVFAYIVDCCLRVYFRKFIFKKEIHVFKEYVIVAAGLTVAVNTVTLILLKAELIDMGKPLSDFLLLNLIYIPLDILYYTLLRDKENADYYRRQTVQLLETELKLLKAQFHPHFLFNALNTIYFQVNEENKEAKVTIEQLSELLRYSLYDSNDTICIRREWNMTETYAAFQSRRKPVRLRVIKEYDKHLDEEMIHPLLFQPLVENAFKFVGGDYVIAISLKPTADGDIVFRVTNSLPATIGETTDCHGIGIENLQKRLRILYGQDFSLETYRDGNSFTANLTLPSIS